jgi:hypothetical protein
LAKPSVKIIYPPGLDEQKIVDFSKTGDTAMVYSKNMDFDSVSGLLSYDNNKPVDTTSLRKARKESFTRNIAFRYGVDINSELRPGADLKDLYQLTDTGLRAAADHLKRRLELC